MNQRTHFSFGGTAASFTALLIVGFGHDLKKRHVPTVGIEQPANKGLFRLTAQSQVAGLPFNKY